MCVGQRWSTDKGLNESQGGPYTAAIGLLSWNRDATAAYCSRWLTIVQQIDKLTSLVSPLFNYYIYRKRASF